jgi:pyruvate, orthophosphate dikinase
MVFGDLDERSGTGVLFTRDPMCGRAEPLGEWLPMGGCRVRQRRPLPISYLAQTMPEAHRELLDAAYALARHQRDVQGVEFTIEGGQPWLLPARAAKRSPTLPCGWRYCSSVRAC